ncbi:hypothetical protein AKI39_18575 [Bordetella sp. H567]|uniref:KGG domain-containing protein n=1 Tax=Bordetella sp. H567 TaxID=1697043 RepID=UPI00081C75D8|nr:KGG domain-containing protein [Bordetella sp. H567]AOB32296.1 hypothetical protein AKI39_18575 [Bordetella sp. H567]
MMTEERKTGRKPRGFAAMDPELLRGIAAQGGRAAHAMGKAHRFDSQEAKQAAAKRHAGKSVKPDAGKTDRTERDREEAHTPAAATVEHKS